MVIILKNEKVLKYKFNTVTLICMEEICETNKNMRYYNLYWMPHAFSNLIFLSRELISNDIISLELYLDEQIKDLKFVSKLIAQYSYYISSTKEIKFKGFKDILNEFFKINYRKFLKELILLIDSHFDAIEIKDNKILRKMINEEINIFQEYFDNISAASKLEINKKGIYH